jgi:hypothetical protein
MGPILISEMGPVQGTPAILVKTAARYTGRSFMNMKMKMKRFWPESAKHLLAQNLGAKMITKIDTAGELIKCNFWPMV